MSPPTRLVLAIAVSLTLHLVLLLLQFGQYGAGLPGLGWPDTDRHARDQPALSIIVKQPAQTVPQTLSEGPRLSPPVSISNPLTPAPVDSFVMVPRYQAPIVTAAVVPARAAGKKTASAPSRVAVLSSPKQNLDFKVAQPVASDAEPASTDEASSLQPPEPAAGRDQVPAVPVQDLEETQALARRSADQEQSLKEQQNQQLATIADETRKISEALQRQESADREALQRAQLAQQMHDAEQAQEQVQQRSREQAMQQKQAQQQALEQLKVQRLQRERLERMQQERRLADQQLAEQQRIEQQRIEQQRIEQQRVLQHQLQQHNEQLAAGRATQSTQNRVHGTSGVDELTGEPILAPGKVRLDADRMLAGRSADFERAASTLETQPDSPAQNGERRSIFGRKTADIELTLYKQSWRQKIERNGSLNYSQIAKDRMHTDPVVTVSVRSDGSLDGVVILRSSGRPEMDEAVRRIAALNAPYSAFPPGLASRFDIIDIRQIWIFDDTLRIADEM